MRRRQAMALLCGAVLAAARPGHAAVGAVGIAVADFDYTDSSGEAIDQSAAHRARIATFATLLRQNLRQRDYRVIRPDCAAASCTASEMAPAQLIAAARQAGARYLLYGGIRKMSTLVQWGEVQLLDLDREQLVLRRTVTFRGDTDEAFRRAADFVGDTVNGAIAR
ncbi:MULTISPECIES: DUF2380 domain-containing protein [Rhodopseudomonas]|uniref:DUF2380 domain-containing protein n=1 Tax=Rhodopseudomonas TaxID=1073 RepID=UPI0009B97178|nr:MULTISPECIES: DUF2380 domain-containing protein [Rhodopseudomonas]MDF3813897.1 DUF2380 domain-containing protein [Rhodopseudomonas sp. BAL398]WOK18286.1 DUF2380 domain-containing protein [Rhodopseudomonas sp. BAL398]